MDLLEFSAKRLLDRAGIPVQRGRVLRDLPGLSEILEDLQAPWVIKAQIYAGGRGKAGGIRFIKTLKEATAATKDILGANLVTNQTGAKGEIAHSLYVVEALPEFEERYLSLSLNTTKSCISIMVTEKGGMDIEENRDGLTIIDIPTTYGLRAFHIQQVLDAWGLPPEAIPQGKTIIKTLYTLFINNDLSLLEINPLALTPDGKLWAVDAKISVDEDAVFRQTTIQELKKEEAAPLAAEEAREKDALDAGLRYVSLDGTIGCIVNGAGLAMATVDGLALKGLKAANFLDVGGTASLEQLKKAIQIVLSDPSVDRILIQIFGGIMQCDRVAQALLESYIPPAMPLVVRFEGTHAAEAFAMLENTPFNIQTAPTMADVFDAIAKPAKTQRVP